MSRYVIIGAGAIGAPVAAQLRATGASVVLVARGAHGGAIRADGLRYVRPDGERRVQLPVVGSAGELDLTIGDVLVVATKTHDTEAVLQEWAWRPVIGGTTAAESLPLISLQNGLENERAALRRFARVSGAAVWMPSSYLRPGEVVAPGEPSVGVLWLGGYPSGLDPDAPAWATDLRRANFVVRLVEDLPRWKAGKLLSNLANAVDALYVGQEGTGPLRRALQAEGRRVLEAAGHDPADLTADPEIDLAGFRLAPGLNDRYGGSSTRQSLGRAAGRTEADFLNGEIVLLGRLHGVPAPLNAAVQAAVAQAARDGVPPGGGDQTVLDDLLGIAGEVAR
ncbi:ketopantoate reductase family protein [Cryptosporangium aurantiacum]|uniref:Ketopantoate reductase n=1 Tax=Cryptosporangium aurantiacum TaxID=134849 RepID=A0A1M7RIK5_9ACTN|nr:2-dehydropantoate 2-reductase N-terminal domain-containing protein [Cryptosporangium aurantiacum]SHN46107.1 ketopantoate reductase [Cryptosporangium aurantiacum]